MHARVRFNNGSLRIYKLEEKQDCLIQARRGPTKRYSESIESVLIVNRYDKTFNAIQRALGIINRELDSGLVHKSAIMSAADILHEALE